LPSSIITICFSFAVQYKTLKKMRKKEILINNLGASSRGMNWKEFILYDASIGEPTKRSSTKLIKPTGGIKKTNAKCVRKNRRGKYLISFIKYKFVQ